MQIQIYILYEIHIPLFSNATCAVIHSVNYSIDFIHHGTMSMSWGEKSDMSLMRILHENHIDCPPNHRKIPSIENENPLKKLEHSAADFSGGDICNVNIANGKLIHFI